MEVPGCLLRETDFRVGQGVDGILGAGGAGGETMEVFLGQIVNIVEERRINFDAPHAVVFNTMPVEYRFDRGICFEAHSRALAHFRGPSVQSAGDTISFSGTTRKVSTGGKVPTYQRKEKRVLCYIHLPACGYDVQVAACTTREVEDPDRRPQSYVFPRQRETHSLVHNGCTFRLTRVADLGRTIDKDRIFTMQSHRLLAYHAGIAIPRRDEAAGDFLQTLHAFMSRGFMRERGSAR